MAGLNSSKSLFCFGGFFVVVFLTSEHQLCIESSREVTS